MKTWDNTEQQKKYRETHKEKIKKYAKDYRERNPEKYKEYQRKFKELRKEYNKTPKMKEYFKKYRHTDGKEKYLKKKYGITGGEYRVLSESQNNVCAICGNLNGKRDLVVDHNHNTGKVRGLLCSNCNTSLGLLKEKEEIMLKMVEYVKKHR